MVGAAISADLVDAALAPRLADVQANSAASLTASTNSNCAALDGGLTNGLEYEATTENAIDHTQPRIAGSY